MLFFYKLEAWRHHPKASSAQGPKHIFPFFSLPLSHPSVRANLPSINNLAMEMESASREKAGLLTRLWTCLKPLPGKLVSKVAGVARKIKKLGQDDPRRVIHSLKVGLALTLISLFYYSRALYKGFGDSAMWAVMTVVVVLEFSVGKFTIS